MGKTYYEILGVAENATAPEIEAAFKAKAREVHPDTVAAENTYLRKVAAEAFKDLSEAKTVLLDVTAREKYDAGLVYSRGSKQTHDASTAGAPTGGASSGSSASSRSSKHSQRSSRSGSSSRSGARSSRTQGAPGAAPRTGKTITRFRDIEDLNSFLFMVLGLATIFFLVVLVSSGRMPPLWLAALTAGLGILSFVNGMRPHALTISSGRTALVISAILAVIALSSLWLLSPSYLEIAIARRAEAEASRLYKPRTQPQPAAARGAASGPTAAVVDESGVDASLPTKVWTNLKDGQNYRTRVNGDALSLEATGDGGKSGGEIIRCEFHRASEASNWTGNCSERGSQGEADRKSSATLSSFSDTRIEGSTSDIPVFVMTPVDIVKMGTAAAQAPAASADPPATDGENTGEPDLSELGKSDRESIELACVSDRLTQGPAKYNECIQKKVDALKAASKPPSLAGLSRADREDLELTCSNVKLMQGPGAYNICLAKQLKILKKRKQ